MFIIFYGIMVIAITVIAITLNAEKRSCKFVRDFVNFPFVSPDQAYEAKVNHFFNALDAVFEEPRKKGDDYFYYHSHRNNVVFTFARLFLPIVT